MTSAVRKRAARGNERLVHVQGDREDGLQAIEAQVRFRQIDRLLAAGHGLDLRLGAADVGQTVYHFRQRLQIHAVFLRGADRSFSRELLRAF